VSQQQPHTKLESAVRYRGFEVDDALEMAEQTEIKKTKRFGDPVWVV